MSNSNWEVKSNLRCELLSVCDKIENLSIKYRGRGLDQEIETELNNLQIRVGELIGKLWR